MPMHVDHGHQSERAWRDEQRRAALALARAARAALRNWDKTIETELRSAAERVERVYH